MAAELQHCVTQCLRLIGHVRQQSVYLFASVAEFICELIEFSQGRLVGSRSHLLKPDVAELTRQGRHAFRLPLE